MGRFAVKDMMSFRLVLSLCLAGASQGQLLTTSASPSSQNSSEPLLRGLITSLKSTLKSGVLDDVGVGATVDAYLLQKMDLIETALQDLQRKTSEFTTETRLRDFIQQTVTAQMQTSVHLAMDSHTGSTFVRWGRKNCTSNSTLVYTGHVGGKHYTHGGSGTNSLCLTRTPHYDDITTPGSVGYIHGTEYEHIAPHHDHDVPCSVCHVPQGPTLMIPGTFTCPAGWTLQYHGHLVSAHHTHPGFDYQCLDAQPEDESSGSRNDDGHLWYLVATGCGALPCPPYVQNKIVTCAVCSHI